MVKSIAAAAFAVLAALAANAATAQEYPARAVTIIVPFPPGGIADITSRTLAPGFERALKQNVVIQNRPGAAGATGAHAAANAAADGYTLLCHLVSISTLPEVDKLFGRPPVFTRDQFLGIARINADPPMLVAHPSVPAKNLKEFVALAKKRAGDMIFSSSGPYGASHVPYAMFLQAIGAQMRHLPTTGGAPAMTAVLGGHAVSWASPPAIAAPHLKAGKIRAYAIWGGSRLADFPDIPSFKEQGIDVEFYLWAGLFAQRNVPSGVFKTLRDAVRQAVQDPDVKKGFEKVRTPIAYQDADEFKAWWDKDAERLAAVVKRIGKVEAN
ncbi:MAG: tripartite tricarboxylate transporter substrate binding protein [Betaproteobacteria bacterium]|nr:tripartite tricarboxylate transporter substrate binding protein [Betaproteobacteria bacterium]